MTSLLESLPIDMIATILLLCFPYVGDSKRETYHLLTIRSTSRAIRAHIDLYLLQNIKTIDNYLACLINNDGLSLFRGLRELDLTDVIRSFVTEKGLRHLTTLESLSFSYNRKINIRSLRTLSHLKRLNLEYVKVTLHGLSSLSNLEELTVAGRRELRDEALLCVPGLKKLTLRHNTFFSGSCFVALTRLESLRIYGDSIIKTCALLPLLSTLRDLVLPYTIQSGTLSLSKMTNLESLYLRHCLITEQLVSDLTKLTRLGTNSQYGIDNRVLSTLTRLQELDMTGYDENLGDLNESTYQSLARLTIRRGKLPWRWLERCTNLKEIYYLSLVDTDESIHIKKIEERGVKVYYRLPTNFWY